jgi:hypothetical protein
MTSSPHPDLPAGALARPRRPSALPWSGALWSTWFLTVTAAEVLGFTAPLTAGALTADAGPAVAVPALLAAGAVEGAVLGTGQAGVLRRVLPELSGRRWVAATSAAAVLCYALGLLPATASGAWAPWPAALVFIVALLLGLLLLGAIGAVVGAPSTRSPGRALDSGDRGGVARRSRGVPLHRHPVVAARPAHDARRGHRPRRGTRHGRRRRGDHGVGTRPSARARDPICRTPWSSTGTQSTRRPPRSGTCAPAAPSVAAPP